MMCSIAELAAPTTSVAKMSDLEFDSIMTGYVAHRRSRLESSYGLEPDRARSRLGQHVVGVDERCRCAG